MTKLRGLDVSLVTLPEVRGYLSLSAGVADTSLQTLITNYSGVVNNFCGRDFELKSFYEEVDIEGTTEQSIKLSSSPLVSVVALTDNGSLIASDDYHVYRQGRISLEADYFTEGFKKVSVSYVAGFTPVPADIKLAVNKLISIDYKTGKRRGFLSEKIGDYSYRMPDTSRSVGFPPSIEQTLRQYKIITGA